MKINKTILTVLSASVIAACGGGGGTGTSNPQPTPPALTKAELGGLLFEDKNLSLNRTQSCATCHDPQTAFVDKRENVVNQAVSVGDDGESMGDRNTPTAAYVQFSPDFHVNAENQFVGGQFLDGREADLQGQAGQPLLNSVEMAMPDKESVIDRVMENSDYVAAFQNLYGNTIFNSTDLAYDALAESIAEFEKTDEFNPFDSKYDRYLRGEYDLTLQEDLGMTLFFSNQFTNCHNCHQLKSIPFSEEETFSNYRYENIGVPVNEDVRLVNGKGLEFIDHGLLDNPQVDGPEHDGKFKVPTLRNVAVTGPYMHNGVFQDLRTVILFYDKFNNEARTLNPETGMPWREAEVPETVNTTELDGAILSDDDVEALIAFLKILTDERYEDQLD